MRVFNLNFQSGPTGERDCIYRSRSFVAIRAFTNGVVYMFKRQRPDIDPWTSSDGELTVLFDARGRVVARFSIQAENSADRLHEDEVERERYERYRRTIHSRDRHQRLHRVTERRHLVGYRVILSLRGNVVRRECIWET